MRIMTRMMYVPYPIIVTLVALLLKKTLYNCTTFTKAGFSKDLNTAAGIPLTVNSGIDGEHAILKLPSLFTA